MKTKLITTENKGRTRWMIVDDNLETLSVVHDICARYAGVEVECFDSPEAALDAFDAEPEAFEFILTDLEMPEAGGFELLRRLRPLSPAVKIFLSIWNDLLSAEEAVEKGFCSQVCKPFPFEALQSAVAPASLEYVERYADFTDDLKLEPAY